MLSAFKSAGFFTLCLCVVFWPVALPILFFMYTRSPYMLYEWPDGSRRTVAPTLKDFEAYKLEQSKKKP